MARLTLTQWVQVGGSIATPILIAIVGYWIQRTIATKSNEVANVGIAVSILKDPETASDRKLRLWALDLLERNSDVHYPVEAFGKAPDPATTVAPSGSASGGVATQP